MLSTLANRSWAQFDEFRVWLVVVLSTNMLSRKTDHRLNRWYYQQYVSIQFEGPSKTCSRNRRNEAVKSNWKSSHCIKGRLNVKIISVFHLIQRKKQQLDGTWFARERVESDSSVDVDCGPRLSIPIPNIGLLVV